MKSRFIWLARRLNQWPSAAEIHGENNIQIYVPGYILHCVWSQWPTFTMTEEKQAGSNSLQASINLLLRIMIFIFSVGEDEWIKIETWAAPAQRLKSDSAIIRRCSRSRNSASLIALKVIFRHGNPKSVQDFDVFTGWLQNHHFHALERPIT